MEDQETMLEEVYETIVQTPGMTVLQLFDIHGECAVEVYTLLHRGRVYATKFNNETRFWRIDYPKVSHPSCVTFIESLDAVEHDTEVPV